MQRLLLPTASGRTPFVTPFGTGCRHKCIGLQHVRCRAEAAPKTQETGRNNAPREILDSWRRVSATAAVTAPILAPLPSQAADYSSSLILAGASPESLTLPLHWSKTFTERDGWSDCILSVAEGWLCGADIDAATAAKIATVLSPVLSFAILLMICRVPLSWYPNLNIKKLPWVIPVVLTEPVLRPTRKAVPPVGGVDVAPVSHLSSHRQQLFKMMVRALSIVAMYG